MYLSRKQLGIVLAVTILSTVLALTPVVYVLAQGGSTTFTISSGIYPGAPSYTVYSVSGTYYAKNAYGVISYSSTNASFVINSAINSALPNGKVVCVGTLTLDKPILITLTEYSTLTFTFDTLIFTMNESAFTVYTAAEWLTTPITITGNLIQCSFEGYDKTALQLININHAKIDVAQLYLSGTYTAGTRGLRLYAVAPSTDCSFNRIYIKKITNFETAIHLESTGAACDANEIFNAVMDYCSIGVNMQYSEAGRVNNNKFYGLNADAFSSLMTFGFRNLGDGNAFFACMVYDENYSSGMVAWFTDARTTNNRPRLYGCAGLTFTGSFIHSSTVGFITENSGQLANVDDGEDIPHGLSGKPTSVYLQNLGSGATVRILTWDSDNSDATTFRVGVKNATTGEGLTGAWIAWRAYYEP